VVAPETPRWVEVVRIAVLLAFIAVLLVIVLG
jgi:hypothetical protein